jgi:diguanylate cyclase (GGDEF)-like protein
MEILTPLGPPAILLFLLFPLFSSLKVMPASEVIVTSREFVVGSLSTAILILSSKLRILDWNRTDWGKGYPLPYPSFKEHIDHYRLRMLEENACRVSPHNNDIVIVEHEGMEKHFFITTRIAGNKKETFGYILEISEVTPLYTLLRHFEDIAYHDHLTKLYNRNAYLEVVKSFVSEENMPLLIFVGDVNLLKQLNDEHGHLMGDELLKTVANIIVRAMPRNAFAARIGGDEFVMLVPQGSDDIARKFAQDMINLCLATNHEVFGSPTVSWGYAIMTSMNQSYNEVFSQADRIMYQYKKTRHEFHSSGLLPDNTVPQPLSAAAQSGRLVLPARTAWKEDSAFHDPAEVVPETVSVVISEPTTDS